MTEKPHGTADPASISLWLVRARSNGAKCFICHHIAEHNAGERGEIESIRISGIEITPDTQIAHLARCVGREMGNASSP